MSESANCLTYVLIKFSLTHSGVGLLYIDLNTSQMLNLQTLWNIFTVNDDFLLTRLPNYYLMLP